MTDRLLVLVRHGQSDWNLKNLFTGWRDVDLTEKGIAEAREAGRKLKAQGITFDVAFTSALKRAQHTLDLMLEEMGQTAIPVIKDQALNERDYGDLVRPQQGRRAQEMGRGAGAYLAPLLRRRAARRRKPARTRWRACCLITSRKSCRACCAASACWSPAHGNSLRALVMVLDRHTPESIVKRNLDTGVPMIYRLNADSTVASKLDLAA